MPPHHTIVKRKQTIDAKPKFHHCKYGGLPNDHDPAIYVSYDQCGPLARFHEIMSCAHPSIRCERQAPAAMPSAVHVPAHQIRSGACFGTLWSGALSLWSLCCAITAYCTAALRWVIGHGLGDFLGSLLMNEEAADELRRGRLLTKDDLLQSSEGGAERGEAGSSGVTDVDVDSEDNGEGPGGSAEGREVKWGLLPDGFQVPTSQTPLMRRSLVRSSTCGGMHPTAVAGGHCEGEV